MRRSGKDKTDYPGLLAFQCKTSRYLLAPFREFRFDQKRRWRFDLAWPAWHIAVEVDGGGFIAGRHSRGVGMEKDCEKYANAMLQGWRVLRVTPKQVQNGQALNWIEQLMDIRETR